MRASRGGATCWTHIHQQNTLHTQLHTQHSRIAPKLQRLPHIVPIEQTPPQIKYITHPDPSTVTYLRRYTSTSPHSLDISITHPTIRVPQRQLSQSNKCHRPSLPLAKLTSDTKHPTSSQWTVPNTKHPQDSPQYQTPHITPIDTERPSRQS